MTVSQSPGKGLSLLERCAIRHGLFPPSRGLTAPCLPFPSPLPPLAARALHAHTLPGILGAGASDATNGWPKGVASSTHKLWEVPNGVRSCGGEREVAAVPLASPLPARALRRVVSCALLSRTTGHGTRDPSSREKLQQVRIRRLDWRRWRRYRSCVHISGPVLRRYPIDSGYMRRQERR